MSKQGLNWHVKEAKVEKREYKDGPVVETVRTEGNLITNSGLARVASLLVADDPSLAPLSDEHVRLGVGDDSAAALPTDTSLGDPNEFYQVMEDTYPQVTASEVTFRSEYSSLEANFVWECWGLDVTDESPGAEAGSSPDDLFNRKVFNFGEKDGGVWTLTVTVGLS